MALLTQEPEKPYRPELESADGVEDPFAGLTQIVVVQNWFSELERLVPTP